MMALILSEADYKFVTAKSRLSAVKLCIKYERTAILGRLEELGASSPDDGSLHMAALHVVPGICAILLVSGHNPNCPDIQTGRTALAELCFNGSHRHGPNLDEWKSRVRETMEILVPVTNMMMKFDFKFVLHLALDNNNPNSTSIAESLLSVWKPWELPDRNDVYLVKDSHGTSYSPTKYVECCCRSKSNADKTHLIHILSNSQFSNRYFAAEGQPQPTGAVGFPPNVENTMLEQRATQSRYERAVYEENMAQQLHVNALARQSQAEQARMKLDDKWHKQELRHSNDWLNQMRGHINRLYKDGMLQRPLDLDKVAKLIQDNPSNRNRAIENRPDGNSGRVKEVG
jgi:hypothetical protein